MSSFTSNAEQNFNYIKQLPIVKQLLKDNKRLRRKNKDLKKLVKLVTRNVSLFPHCDTNGCNAPAFVDDSTTESSIQPNVSYEIHEDVSIKSEQIYNTDSDVEIIDAPKIAIDVIDVDEAEKESEEEIEEDDEEEIEVEEEEEEEEEGVTLATSAHRRENFY